MQVKRGRAKVQPISRFIVLLKGTSEELAAHAWILFCLILISFIFNTVPHPLFSSLMSQAHTLSQKHMCLDIGKVT